MELKYFIRVEGQNGIGPYQGINYEKTKFEHNGRDGKHPVVWWNKDYNDWEKSVKGYSSFCLESIDQMKEWFTEEERILMMCEDFLLKKVSSDNYFITDKQCVCEIKEYIKELDWE